MSRNKRKRFRAPSPAMVVACIALTIALSGASYAAVVLPRNSVGTAQLKKNAVTSAKVKDRSLTALDFGLGQLPQGPQGPQGAAGPQGPAGAQGARGPSFGEARYPSSVAISSCGTNNTAVVQDVTLTAPSRLFVAAQGTYSRTDPGPEQPTLRVELLSGSSVLASTQRPSEIASAGQRELLFVSGVLRQAPSGTTGFTIPAGTYSLRIYFDLFGTCAGTGTFSDVSLSHIVLGTTP